VATSEINSIVCMDASGQPVTHEDVLNIVRQLVRHEIMEFASVASRTAILATLNYTPNKGATCYLQTEGRYEVYSGGWQLWDYSELVDAVDTNVAATTVTTSGATELDLGRLAHLNVAVRANQTYLHTITLNTSRTVAGDEFELRLRQGTALVGTILATSMDWGKPSTAGQPTRADLLWTPAADATTSVYLSVVRNSGGTGTLSVYFSQFGTRGRCQSIMTRLGPSARYRTIVV
jgi:hypothetical protein